MKRRFWAFVLACAAVLGSTFALSACFFGSVGTTTDFVFTRNSEKTAYTITTFYNSGTATSVEIPSRYAGLPVTGISSKVFKDCSVLETVTFAPGSTVDRIGDSAFEGCGALHTINLPSTLETIGSRAFFGCSSLRSITLPSALRIIGSSAFTYCYRLTEVFDFTSLGLTANRNSGGGVLLYAKAVHTAPEAESVQFIENDFVFVYDAERDEYAVIDYRGVNHTIELPETVREKTCYVASYAFSSRAVYDVTIPAGVTYLEDRVFYGCALTKAHFAVTTGWVNYTSSGTVLEIDAALLADASSAARCLTTVENNADERVYGAMPWERIQN